MIIERNGVALRSDVAATLEKRHGRVARIDTHELCSARACDLLERFGKCRAHPLAREVRMHIKHIDGFIVLKGPETEVFAVELDDEGQRPGEPVAESCRVLGGGDLGKPLIVVVIVSRQLIDALREEIAQHHGVSWQEWTERIIVGHC